MDFNDLKYISTPVVATLIIISLMMSDSSEETRVSSPCAETVSNVEELEILID